MSALASIVVNGTFLAILAILAFLATALAFPMTHAISRAARLRSGLQRRREQQRREYWGYE